jgi:hypothetical protein
MDNFIGFREELMHGDYRALFLGWLADFSPDAHAVAASFSHTSTAERLPLATVVQR